jgi:hypothetical protein
MPKRMALTAVALIMGVAVPLALRLQQHAASHHSNRAASSQT